MHKLKFNSTILDDYIIDNIDLEGYDIPEPSHQKFKLKALHDIFISEYGWFIKQGRGPRVKALQEWLMGLPSTMSLPYTYYEIEKLMRFFGVLNANSNDSDIEFINENYWGFIANRLNTLFNKNGIK